MSLKVKAVALGARLVPRRVALALYRFPPLASAIRRTLNAGLPGQERLQMVEVVQGPIRGARFMLDLSIEKYLWIGTYEPWVQNAIATNLRPGMRAWDIGGFIGYHTMAMCRTSPSQVVVLEPDPDNRRRLETTLRLNDVFNVVVLPVAAGREKATGVMDRAERNPSETRIRTGGGELDLPVVPLDDLLDTYGRPDLVKVDVEGLEGDVLAGAPRLVDEARPVWIIEIHGGLGTGKEVAARLRGAGYKVRRLGADGPVDNVMEDSPGHILAVP